MRVYKLFLVKSLFIVSGEKFPKKWLISSPLFGTGGFPNLPVLLLAVAVVFEYDSSGLL